MLIARDTEMSGFEYRIKAELENAGFTVEIFEMDFREDTRRIMDIEAHARNAAAAIVCRQQSGFVEIWISDKVTNKNVLRRVAIPDDEDAEAFVALSTVELLRASLLEIYTATKLTGSVEPTPVIHSLVAPGHADDPGLQKIQAQNQRRLHLQLNPAVFVLRFEGNPMLNIQLGASYDLAKGVELRFHGQTPLLPHHVYEDAGNVLVRSGYLATGLLWNLVYPKQIASGDIGIGMAMLIHRVTGQPIPGNIGYQRTFVTAAPHITFGMDVRLVQNVRIRLETIAGWSLSKITLQVAENDVAEIGNFFISVGLGLLFTI